MKNIGPSILVIVAFGCYQIGAEVRWAKGQFEKAKAEAVETKREIDKLTRETTKAVERFRVVLDDISKVFTEMENEAVAASDGRVGGGVVGDVHAKPSAVDGINGNELSSDGNSGANEQPAIGSRTTGKAPSKVDFPRFD